ncbi:MAG: Fic family protein [Acidimicrobiales bacterium]
MGRFVKVTWEGKPVEAFVPHPLSRVGPLASSAQVAAARACGALTAMARHHDRRLDVAARLLLRSEGVASSRIEAITAPADLVAIADVDRAVPGEASEVADNLRAIDAALDHDGPLTREDLWEWHRVLMASADLDPDLVGGWRDRLGWVGGPTPHRAAHVATPHDRIDDLMSDLVSYATNPAHDVVAAAALVHAQFETIHPFADGNGRIGRLLISWMFHRHLDLAVPPPLSVAFLCDVGGYLSGLALYRSDGADEWVRWFADTVERSAVTAGDTLAAVTDLVGSWPERLADVRADAAARRLIEHVIAHPALDVATTVELLAVSAPTARNALETLTERGILRPADTPSTGADGHPRHWWVAGDLLELLTR